ncbi:MAG: hypothetical protein HY287_03905 [Planctomycetes bacterium]|nr:hypothetical protein [Planctomycetota bacterium]MBI3833457.1 hypothetical protein [Planctomycetota bacterium]
MNAIMVIFPYRHQDTWVFDDESVGLRQEPFVWGADEIIDRMVAEIPAAGNGFRLLFSPTPFPGHQYSLRRLSEEFGGNWYVCEELNMQGWLCPALFRYFDHAPERIYISVEAKQA